MSNKVQILKRKVHYLEHVLMVISVIYLTGVLFYFNELLFPDNSSFHPFHLYNNHAGIIGIMVSNFIAMVVFFASFIALQTEKFSSDVFVLNSYLISALIIALLQWFELYYGSTFYYGEVRDKHGIMFPFYASFLLTMVIWKVRTDRIKRFESKLRFLISIVVNILLVIFWFSVQESWKLWQS